MLDGEDAGDSNGLVVPEIDWLRLMALVGREG
jgi:hypothetical protein